jgi:hypothetical protein
MTTYTGGTQVKSGYYVDTAGFAVATISRDGLSLPGGSGARWVRVPALAVMAAAPVVGGLFVVALPFLGFGLGAWALGRAVAGKLKGGAEELAATVAPTWAPGEAHLTGAPGEEKKDAAAAAPDAKIEQLAEDIETRRKDREP